MKLAVFASCGGGFSDMDEGTLSFDQTVKAQSSLLMVRSQSAFGRNKLSSAGSLSRGGPLVVFSSSSCKASYGRGDLDYDLL
ncbi:hypothetical protein ACOSQ3_023860 [Xanthoceras sorbifolium]